MTNLHIKAVSIGGGCGAVQVLLGLSNHLAALTGIVAVNDTGRSTGKVRALANIPAPGDIRNAIATLATNEAFMAQLMQHRLRVPNNTTLDGVAFGNLMLAAITQMTGHFGQAVELMQNMAGVKANILPVTVSSTHICAELVDGQIIEQEFNVRALGKPDIRRVYIQDPAARAYESAPPRGGMRIPAASESDAWRLDAGSALNGIEAGRNLCRLVGWTARSGRMRRRSRSWPARYRLGWMHRRGRVRLPLRACCQLFVDLSLAVTQPRELIRTVPGSPNAGRRSIGFGSVSPKPRRST